MGIDIRTPIGVMFTILGAILTVYGPIADKAIYERSLGININLWWGIVVLVFGILMLLLGRRHASAMRSSNNSVEGRKT